eukprot:3018409-Ditylum_brightwellii.AAC.1
MFEHSVLQTASSPIAAETFYKSGGVLSLTQGSLVGRKIVSGEDELGQWTYTKFVTKNNAVITAVLAYQ